MHEILPCYLKGYMSWGHCRFQSIIPKVITQCLNPNTKCSHRVMKKISNKLHQGTLSLVIILLILLTISLDYVLIQWGENWWQTLLGLWERVKGITYCLFSFTVYTGSCRVCYEEDIEEISSGNTHCNNFDSDFCRPNISSFFSCSSFSSVATGNSTVAQKGRTCKLKMLLQIKNFTCKLKMLLQIKNRTCKLKIVHAN